MAAFKTFLLVLFIGTLLSPLWLFAMTDTTAVSHEEEVRAWHERRIKNLLRDYGWLTLVALDWLQEGTNTIRDLGVLTLTKGTVSLTLKLGVRATVNDQPFTSGLIRAEGSGAPPDTVKVDSRAFIVIKRGERFALRMWDTQAQNRREFSGIERFPVSRNWRIEARWQPYDPPKTMKVPTIIAGYEEDYPVPGVAIFEIGGKEYRLEPVLEEPNGDYFFIFGDKTNGTETYGAGRFLYAKPAQGGRVILDFNKSYNPPCAFTEFATCPLPPPQNKLPIRIEAGEKKYGIH
jgi:uncharacterized protein (DUF1684 family)